MDEGAISLVLVPPTRDLGDGFQVRRALPSARRRMVGPFIFVDQMGPAEFDAGRGLDVRPHPHIGLATVTYVFEGEILHRDSLGSVQPIRPGEVNWMIAGRGIAHSERTAPEIRTQGPSRLFGMQTWVALPAEHEEVAPDFVHHGAEALPVLSEPGMTMRIIAGELMGARSPVQVHSPMFYAAVELEDCADVTLPPEYDERAIYVVEGTIEIAGEPDPFPAAQLLVVKPGEALAIRAIGGPARLMFLGGEPIGERHIWWNFVSSSTSRLHEAADAWRAQRFERIPGETEFIPLPDWPPLPKLVVDYP